MTPHQKNLMNLVDRLSQKTLDGELTWGEDNPGVFSTRLSSAKIEVKADKDGIGQETVKITLFDKSDNIKLVFDDNDILEYDDRGNPTGYYEEMTAMLDAALRSARGESQILASVLSELSNDDPF